MNTNQYDADDIIIAKKLALKEAKEKARELGFEFSADELEITRGIYNAILKDKYGIDIIYETEEY